MHRPDHELRATVHHIRLALRSPVSHVDGLMSSPRPISRPVLVHRPDWSTIRVVGPDRISWLDRIVSQNLSNLLSGQLSYALLLDPKGRLVCDVTVAAMDEALWLAVPSSLADSVLDLLDSHLIMEDAEVSLVSQPLVWGWMLGDNRGREEFSSVVDGLDVVCSGRWGETNASVLLAPEARWPEISRGWQEGGGKLLELADATPERLLLGVPLFGIDLTPKRVPSEMGMDGVAVSLNKRCYLGQEGVARVRGRGSPNRALRRLVFEDACDVVPVSGTDVMDQAGKKMGQVFSAAVVPATQQIVAFAWIRRVAEVNDASLRVGDCLVNQVVPAWGPLQA